MASGVCHYRATTTHPVQQTTTIHPTHACMNYVKNAEIRRTADAIPLTQWVNSVRVERGHRTTGWVGEMGNPPQVGRTSRSKPPKIRWEAKERNPPKGLALSYARPLNITTICCPADSCFRAHAGESHWLGASTFDIRGRYAFVIFWNPDVSIFTSVDGSDAYVTFNNLLLNKWRIALATTNM